MPAKERPEESPKTGQKGGEVKREEEEGKREGHPGTEHRR